MRMGAFLAAPGPRLADSLCSGVVVVCEEENSGFDMAVVMGDTVWTLTRYQAEPQANDWVL